MNNSVKTNRLAIISFGIGVVVLLSLLLYWVLFTAAYPPSPGYVPESENRILSAIMDLSVSVRNLCAPGALITGVLALLEIKKRAGCERQNTRWAGIVLALLIIFGIWRGNIFLWLKTSLVPGQIVGRMITARSAREAGFEFFRSKQIPTHPPPRFTT